MNWLQKNVIPVLFCAVASLVAALAIMFSMWQGAMHEVDTYRRITETQGKVIEAQSRITQNETHVNHVTERVVQRIMEAPNAETPVPNNLAVIWADGIDSVWDDGGKTDGSGTELHGYPRTEAPSGGADDGTSASVLGPTGSSVPKVQLPDQ